jgi:CO/xanthine dehydrogenase FAD-binding subunit
VDIDDFLRGPYSTDLKPGEIITAVDVPMRPACRWGAAKVTRKSGAFASSMAIVVMGAGGPNRVVLGATTSRPRLLPQLAAALVGGGGSGWDGLVEAEVRAADPDADAYAMRAHAATVRKAVREALAP